MAYGERMVGIGFARFAGEVIAAVNTGAYKGDGKGLELGVRPEFVNFADEGVAAEVVRVVDTGRHRIVEVQAGGRSIKLIVREGMPIPSGSARLAFDPAHTQVYDNGWMVGA